MEQLRMVDTQARDSGAPLNNRREILSNTIVRCVRGELMQAVDTLALEAPLDVRLDGKHILRTMRTPGADTDLAAGMLFTSGRAVNPGMIRSLRFHEYADALHVSTGGLPLPSEEGLVRTGEFGVPVWRKDEGASLSNAELADMLFEMRGVLEETQRLYRHTGATHCAMFFDREGNPVSFGEDVGRHNAFDKCVGRAILSGEYVEAYHAVITSRLSHEIVSKAVRTGITVLAGFSTATSIALELAAEHNITLVGRLRNETMNFYTIPE